MRTTGEVTVSLPRTVGKGGFYRPCLMVDGCDKVGHVQMKALHGIAEGRSCDRIDGEEALCGPAPILSDTNRRSMVAGEVPDIIGRPRGRRVGANRGKVRKLDIRNIEPRAIQHMRCCPGAAYIDR